MAAATARWGAATMRMKSHWTDRIAHLTLAAVALALIAFLAAPLARILLQALEFWLALALAPLRTAMWAAYPPAVA